METFAKPAVAAIIEKTENGKDYLLIQTRNKKNGGIENGMTEIPAGKIREYENIFDALRREVWEETGLRVTSIQGEAKEACDETNGYCTICFEPFCMTQNLCGGYSIMVATFICQAEGELLEETNETTDIRWEEVSKVEAMLNNNLLQFYPMHLHALRKYFMLYHINEQADKAR